MINLEQVKLLETKVGKAIDCIERLTGENEALRKKEANFEAQESNLQAKLDTQQKRIDELEMLVMRIKEEQGRIEDSILAALDRLNQFDDAIEQSLQGKPAKEAAKSAAKEPAKSLQAKAEAAAAEVSGEEKICFEIPESDTDILDPLEAIEELPAVSSPQTEGGELDIF